MDHIEIPDRGKIVLLFNSPHCAPCKEYAPVVREACEDAGLALLELDTSTDAGRAYAYEYSIQSVPALMMLENGTPLKWPTFGQRTRASVDEWLAT